MKEKSAFDVRALIAEETAAFSKDRPKSRAALDRARASQPHGVPMAWMTAAPVAVADKGAGAYFTDIDGFRYLDFYQADWSMTAGYAHPAVTTAIAERAADGLHFLLPTRTATRVSEALATRFGTSHWQFTLSATLANQEAIRLCRVVTGKSRILIFDGSNHGYVPETMIHYAKDGQQPYAAGLPLGYAAQTDIVPFNDADAAAQVLGRGETACIVVEPALTNVGLVQPQTGFHDALRTLATRHGAPLILDETHTHMLAYGGLTRHWSLNPDIVVLGKNFASGVAIGAWGKTAELCDAMEATPMSDRTSRTVGLATGGTLFGSALSFAAAEATLTQVLTPQAYATTAAMGMRLAKGIQAAMDRAGLDWHAHHLNNMFGYCYTSAPPQTGTAALSQIDTEMTLARRHFFANRGIWDAVATGGPIVSFAMSVTDIDRYLEVAEDFFRAVRRCPSA